MHEITNLKNLVSNAEVYNEELEVSLSVNLHAIRLVWNVLGLSILKYCICWGQPRHHWALVSLTSCEDTSKTHECLLCTEQVFVKFLLGKNKLGTRIFLILFFLQRLGRNKLQIGAAEREREQNKDTTESSGRITESRRRKTRHIFFSGKFEFSAGLRDSFAFVGGGLNLDITLV